MQRSLIVAAALASIGTSAFAQSSVNLYGRLNVTIERQKVGTAANNWVMQNNASRFGLRGTEDIGGGLKASFVLEHRFNINNGAATNAAFWGGAGQAEVNLAGGFGMVRAGHFTSEAYYATADYISMHNHDTGTSSDAFYAFVDNSSNKIAYRAPAFVRGLTLEASVTAGDAPNGGRRSYDFAANYDAGPLHLGAGYTQLKNSDAEQFAVRALYEMGAFTVGAYIQRDTNGFGPLSGIGSFGDRTTYRLAGMYTMGKTELHLNYGHAGDYGKLAGNSDANQYTLGVNHNLSKRTKVYGFYTKVADKGTIYGDFSSIAVGVRHNF